MTLSERELTVADRYAAGQTHKQIAAGLHIAPSTVRNHLAAIYRKLDVSNKPELIRELSARASDFGILPPREQSTPTAAVLANLDHAGPLRPAGPSIAVMPFVSIGPTPGEHLGHGIAADVQHDLTRCHDLLVSGRSSCLALTGHDSDASSVALKLGVQYVLQGTVRSEQDKFRLTTELVDGATGTILWSERYDRALRDILETEIEVSRTIVGNLSLQIDEAQYQQHRRLEDDELTAYDWRLRGNRCLELGGRRNLDTARNCFSHALELEPESAAAYAGLSMCFGYECDLLLAEDYGDSLGRHIDFAERAVAADESDSRGHYALACALMLDGQYERADVHSARGMDINPGEYHNICNRGYSLMALGRFDQSIGCFTESLRRNPLAPNSCLLAVGLIEYIASNYGQATGALSRMTSYQLQRASTLAAACAQVGYDETARRAVSEFEQLSEEIPVCPRHSTHSDWRAFWRMAYPYLNDESFEHVLDGLGKATLPVHA